MKKLILIIISSLAINQLANAQKEGLAFIGQADLKAYMEFFASDDMAGRETGTTQNDISALFIKSNLMRLKVKPNPETGDYLQKIPLVSSSIDKANSFLKILNSNGEVIMSTDSVISLMPPSKTMEVTGNVVFAGYGYENKNTGYSDFEGIDIKGKIVIIMTRNPEAVKSGAGKMVFSEQLESMKFASLMMRGPAAVLFVYDPKNSFRDAYASGMAELVGGNSMSFKGRQGNSLPLQVLFITRNSADNLLKPEGYNLEQMQERISAQGKPVSCEITGLMATVRTALKESEISASNVIGIIEGSDPVLKNECIVYSAHFDHTGLNANGEAYNGADDNASGSMTLLEIAEAFTNLKQKPLRTIVFVWVNGEEKGMLGSRYYTENPVIPMEKTIVDINLDMVGRSKMAADTGKFYGYTLDITQPGEINVYTGHESSELLEIMNASAKAAGIKVNDKGAKIEAGSSDHASFIAKKVPALCFNSGIHSDLHRIGDDVEKIDFDKMEKSAKMCFLIGYKIASQQKRMIVDNPQ
ncbi:MAG: M20/M25/M40 family metallo-hydrolase [Bacteroidia bacterium]|nr:M20/M25/M40 family metallo-hydrolase [Bacteroidia bacterium]